MSTDPSKVPRLEELLAGLLHYGTWLASSVIGLGLILALLGWHSGAHDPATLSGMHIVTAGIACFILLPVLRVILMLIVFFGARDYHFVVIAAIVLIILLVGLVIGACLSKSLTPA